MNTNTLWIAERCRYLSWEAFAHVAKRTFVVGLRAQNSDLDRLATLANELIALRTNEAREQAAHECPKCGLLYGHRYPCVAGGAL